MRSSDIRSTFIRFFTDRDHQPIPSHSLLPPDQDTSVLFTTCGMQPLVPYLEGAPHPGGRRLVNSQRCLRTVDLDEVGDSSHLTFFEMLGSWSLGDYFKREALTWSLELLCDRFGLDPGRLCATTFGGDETVEPDVESPEIWRDLGLPTDRVFSYGREHNWWSLGRPGPCGPDSEIFCWTGTEPPQTGPADDSRWLEVWNIVFMEYEQLPDGTLTQLSQRNVDTGMGLERLTCLLQDVPSVYDTDLFEPIMARVSQLTASPNRRSQRIVSDHLRTSVMLVSDGVTPSNREHGYVLRRLIRRSVRHSRLLGISSLSEQLTPTAISTLSDVWPDLPQQSQIIVEVIEREERQFSRTLTRGLRELEKIRDRQRPVDGTVLHRLFETHGLPPEISVEELTRLGWPPVSDWQDSYRRSVEQHRQRSQ
jgi:alanyl-tRNA synthetase